MKDNNLNLLKIFDILGHELNLSKASKILGIGQPALSHSLQLLREEFNDPLFVRAQRGLVATDKAIKLLPLIRKALEGLSEVYQREAASDFKKLEKNFTLASTGYFEIRVVEKLMNELQREAPQICLQTRSLQGEFPKGELETGEIDLAIAAYFKKLPKTFKVKSLGIDPHVCVCRKKSPYLKSKQTLNDYLAFDHVKIDIPPGQKATIDLTLEELKKKRKIVAYISNFFTPPLIVAANNVLLTCPETLAKSYCQYYDLEMTELPIKTAPIEIKMVWHQRNHNDKFHQWMRNTVSNIN